MSKRFSEVLTDHLCRHESKVQGLFGLCSVIFLLLLVSLAVVESGSATYVIVVVDLVSVIVIGGIAGVIMITCQRRRKE